VSAALPIEPLLPEIAESLRRSSRLVLRAPPGAGKTTRVPEMLLDAGLAQGKQVVVLEPRRIAARAAAEFVARARGGAVGGEVGYRVRFEQKGGQATRLWFVTEGVFSRGLIRDPYLEEIGVVVLDEFHERHLQGDVALGVVRELQESVRPDLKLVVMSATLDTGKVSAFLTGATIVTSEGRAHPVEIEYAREPSRARLSARVFAALARELRSAPRGDVLVFLPGAAAIRETAEAIVPLAAEHTADIVLLHGDLSLDAQRRAIEPGPRRKVVLSTNVAETALTIEGVRTVIDSGLAREARFDARHGVNRLEEMRISRAAAEQRAGRAGRTGPGRCLRLWSAAEHAERKERELPEALRLDLSAVALELRAWGVRDLGTFPWLDPPREGALERAERLLALLGAVDGAGAVTEMGRRMLDVPAPPRLARMLLEADRHGMAEGGALVAALASERDMLLERRALARGEGGLWASGQSDLALRLELFREAERAAFEPRRCRAIGLDAASVRAVDRARRQFSAGLGRRRTARGEEDALLRCVLAGFPDRVARRRQAGSSRAVMVGGGGVVLDPSSVVRDAELFVAVDLEGARGEHAEARVRLASAVEQAWLEEMFPRAFRTAGEVVFDAGTEHVVKRVQKVYEDLVLDETVSGEVDPPLAAARLAEAARENPASALAIGREEKAFLERVAFLATAMPALGLEACPESLLGAAIDALAVGKRSFAELRKADLSGALRSRLTRRQLQALDREAPERLRLPSGREVRLAYERGRAPVLAARIQELFGLTATPRIAAGRVPLVLHILAPSDRPVQVTEDLASFWKRTYPEVRKQLRGRYPKHAWPESPAASRR
jgi:ATP-dependent helicase HrpB